jgi:hypothetical protein
MRGRLLESGRFYSSRIRKSENEIEETRKNLSALRVFPNHEWPLRLNTDHNRSDGCKRYVVRRDEKLTAFVERESAIRACGDLV